MDLFRLTQILRDLNCPLLLKEDSWWLEGILFTPGRARRELLQWIVEQLSQANKREEEQPTITSSADGKTDSTTETSTVSSGAGAFDSDEGLFKYCQKVGLCSAGDLNLITGEATIEKQVELWTVLLTSLHMVSLKNVDVAASLNYVNDITQSRNFLVIVFVLKIELKQRNKIFTRDALQNDLLHSKGDGQSSLEEEADYTFSTEAYEKLLEVRSRLKTLAGVFMENSKLDLRGHGPTTNLTKESEELGINCRTLNQALCTLSQSITSLQKLQSNMEGLLSKSKTQQHTSENNMVTDEFLGELCQVWLK